jgi:hypothetical protein
MTLHMCEEAAMAAIVLQAARRQPEARHAALKPLDPEIVSATIPAFFIGRNGTGLWVAREANGRVGGLFLFKRSAVDFANRQTRPAGCALVFPTDTFELDIENRGNPLIVLVEGARQLLVRAATRLRT